MCTSRESTYKVNVITKLFILEEPSQMILEEGEEVNTFLVAPCDF
jgi:hypothetical protein